MTKLFLLALIGALAMCAFVPVARAAAPAKLKPLPPDYRRICTLGDSITDGFSTGLMLRQALAEAGYQPPTVICAGVASDVTAQMLARLDRDVFPYHPTLVTLLGGTNDSSRGVTLDQYEANVTAIADRMDKEHVKFIIITVPIPGPADFDKREPVVDQYNTFLKQFAAQRGYPVADGNALMLANRAAGRDPIETDNVHPNYLGHQDMTRALLDAMGFQDVPLVKVFKPELMPGIITAWKIRATPASITPPMTASQVAALVPDSTWTTVTLPETTVIGSWWLDQERERGFAMNLDKVVGPGTTWESVGTIDEPAAQTLWLNVGAQTNAVWLNGTQVYKVSPTWTGWHVGHDRVQVQLNKGPNTVVVESQNSFFVSFTPTTDVGP